MRIETVVIGLDFSDASERAARWTAEHFAPAAKLVLVHAIEPPGLPEFLRPEMPELEKAPEPIEREAAQQLKSLARTLGAERTTIMLRTGGATDVLLEAAGENRADLIVAGEQDRPNRLWDMLGSTAERLLHTSPVPVLLARRTGDAVPKNLLVPIEDVPVTARVVECARDLAEQFGARVDLLHVLDNRLVGRVRIISANGAAREFEEKMQASARRWLERVAREAGLDPANTDRTVVFGDARWEVINAARRLPADLIVMGSRGSAPAGQMLLGSVARSVARGADCPVLITTERSARNG